MKFKMQNLNSNPIRWRNGFAAVAMTAVAVAITFAVWRSVMGTALSDEESGHILLVPLVSLWMIWIRRKRLAVCRLRQQWVGLVLLSIGWALWAYGYRSGQHTFWDAGAILAIVGVMVSFLGADILRKFLPAIIVLAFLIPVWPVRRQQLAWPLQLVTAQATQATCELLGFNIVRHGNLLISNGVNVAIAEACNGMRMVLTLALVSFVYAFVTPLKMIVRILVLLSTPITAIAANVIRLVPTVWVYGHASSAAAQKFHDISGWVMLFVAFLLPAICVSLLRWAGVPVMKRPEIRESEASAAAIAPLRQANRGARWIWPALCLALLAGMGATRLSFTVPADAAPYHQRVREAASQLPLQIGRWTGEDVPEPYDVINKLRANVLISRRYEDLVAGRRVTLLLVQCEDAALLAGHYPPTCYHNQGYFELADEPRDWVAGDLRITGTQYEFGENQAGGATMVIANFFVMPDGRILRDIEAVNSAANDIRARYYGAAEFQIVFDPDTPQDERDQIVKMFALACESTIKAIGAGPKSAAPTLPNR